MKPSPAGGCHDTIGAEGNRVVACERAGGRAMMSDMSSSMLQRLHPLALLTAFLAVTFPLWCNAYLSPPDSASYFAVARSLVRGLDLDFRDEYAAMRFERHLVYLTAVDRLSNDWPVGSGILWTPPYAVADVVARATPDGPAWSDDGPDRVAGLPRPLTIGHDEPLLATTGQSGIYKLAVSLAMAVAAWLAMAMAWCTARDVSTPWSALAGVAIVFLGTPVLFYTYAYAMMSHINSMLLVGLVFCEWHRTRPDRTGVARTPADWWRLGMLAGAMTMVRPQDIACLAPFVIEAVAHRRAMDWTAWSRGVAIAAAGALLAFSPQLIVWKCVYGHVLQLPKIEEMHWFAPALGEFLFSSYHGFLAWSPVALLVVPGLWVLARRDAVMATAIGVVVGAQVYLNAANEIWWAGGSFGARRMVAVAVPMMVATAPLVARWKATLLVAAPLVLWNMLLMARERAGLLSLGHHEPWTPAFYAGVLAMIDPRAWVPAMMGDFAGFGWPTRLVVMAAGLSAAVALQRGVHRRPVARRAITWVAVACFAWLAAAPMVVMAAAWRTGTQPPETWDQEPNRENRSLFEGYYEYGFYCLSRDDLDGAAAAFERATILVPKKPQPWRYLATIELMRPDGDAERALRSAEEALRLDPTYGAAWMQARLAVLRLIEQDPAREPELIGHLMYLGRSIDLEALLGPLPPAATGS